MSPRVEMASSPFAGTAFAVAGDAITSTQIFDGTIAAADMASNSITSTKILDGTITTTDIADDSVTSAKIFDGTIVAADLAANSVSGTAIIDNTIDGNDIGFHVLDFTSLANILALDADRTLNQSTFRWTQNFTGTTGPAINLTSSGAVSTGSSAAMNLRVSNAATSVNAVTINNGGIGNSFAVTNGAGADPYYFLIDPTGNVAVGKSTTASRFVVAPPVAETITNGTTVTANACGTIKRIVTLGINIDTDATNTFTAPSDALAGCCMDIVNVGSFNLNFKHNANFMTSGGGDQTLGPDDTMRVCCTGAGGKWYQVSISTNG